jgi:hypothetical protein
MSTAESLTLVIAAIGAIAGLLALGWQIYTWRKRRTPNLSVEVRHRGPWGRMMVSIRRSATPPEGQMPVASEYELVIVVVNRGETDEIVEAISLEPSLVDGTRPDPPFWFHDCVETLPPGGAIKHVARVSELHGAATGAEFVAFATTVSGVTAESALEVIDPEYVRLSELNRRGWWRHRPRWWRR